MSKEIVEKQKEVIEAILNEANLKFDSQMDQSVEEGKNFSCIFDVRPHQFGLVVWMRKEKTFKYAFLNNKNIEYMRKEGFDEDTITRESKIWVSLDDNFNAFIYLLTHPIVLEKQAPPISEEYNYE